MKVSRQPKVSALLRIFAVTFALFWLVGIAICGMGRVCNCAGHEEVCAAHAGPVHEHNAVSAQKQGHMHAAEAHQRATDSHHDDGEAPQGHCGTNGSNGKCYCSTIQALITTMTPVVIPKPVSQPEFNISLLCAAPQHVFAAPPSETLRRAKPRDVVFTPEVCLGPAFHSLAPPAFV